VSGRGEQRERLAAERGYRVYGYRWVVLAAVMAVNFMIQVLWIGYGSIIADAADYYGVSHELVTLLAMVFMIAFIPLSLPAAWVIDSRGFRAAVGFGVVMMGVFGVLRGLAGNSYALVLICTIGIAVAQPFLLNSWTKVPANWFAPGERATAVGLITLASMLGVGAGLALSPVFIGFMSIGAMQLVYGAVAAVSAVAFLALARERPATSPGPAGEEARALMLDGLKHALTVKPFLVILAVAFVIMGVFNGVTSWIGDIVLPRGFGADDAGLLGLVMLVAGVIGAVVLSAMSDRQGKRIRYLMLTLALAIPSLIGVAFVSSGLLLYASSAALGFFIVGALPIGMQYAAEVTFPTPEGTSNGLVQLCGQCSVVFVYIMGPLRTESGSFAVSLVLMSVLLAVSAVVVSRLRDAPPRAGAAVAPPLAVAPPPAATGAAAVLSASVETGTLMDAAPAGLDAPRPPAPIG
jgi:MFS family permease